MKKIIFIALLVLVASQLFAQHNTRKRNKTNKAQATQTTKEPARDTVPQRTVTVTSSFQPTLKPTTKINFSAATPAPDTTRQALQCDVPSQNINFSYQSPALSPLASNIDTNIHWENRSFVKAGYGNFTTPYLQAGVSMGDGVKSVINIDGKFTSS